MERFKIRVKDEDGQIYFDEVDGVEVFQIVGYRFFSHRHDKVWRVSDARTGIRVTESPFYDDAVKAAQNRMENNFKKYLQMLKRVPKATWRSPQEAGS